MYHLWKCAVYPDQYLTKLCHISFILGIHKKTKKDSAFINFMFPFNNLFSFFILNLLILQTVLSPNSCSLAGYFQDHIIGAIKPWTVTESTVDEIYPFRIDISVKCNSYLYCTSCLFNQIHALSTEKMIIGSILHLIYVYQTM